MVKKIYLTIDTECHDIEHPDRHIWGRTRDGRYYGVKKILEIAKDLDIKLNFFVDIAECKCYGVEFIKSITDLITEYGQSVYIHLHPNYISGDEERSYMWQYSPEEQKAIFKEAIRYYDILFPGKKCKSFRIGRYGANPSMYDALEESMGEGIIDFSYCAYSPKMCHLGQKVTGVHNRITKYKKTFLFPNTRYKCFQFGRVSKYLNLDTAESTLGEYKMILAQNKMPFVTLTMHSWNFIRKWFFIHNRVWGDKANIKKFYKMVEYAKAHDYEFGDIEEDYESLINTAYEDQTFDLCDTPLTKLRTLWFNYVRFQDTARLTKKYFVFYSVLYAIGLVVLLIAVLFLIH